MRHKAVTRLKRHETGRMNSLEERYLKEIIAPKMLSGEVFSWLFESINLRLADKTYYRPDFIVFHTDCIEVVEVKGFWMDDARVKWKVAAEQFPMFDFTAVTYKKKEWKHEHYRNDK